MNFDFNPLPKTFSDRFQIGFGKEHFALGLLSGSNISVFVMTPSLMKALVANLWTEIERFEKTYHKIDSSPSGIPSSLLEGIQYPPQSPDEKSPSQPDSPNPKKK